MLHHALKVAPLLALLTLGACGGDDDGPPVVTPIDNQYLPVVISDDLAVGRQRFQVGLIEQSSDGDSPVAGADLHFKFYLIDQTAGTAAEKFDSDPEAVTIQKTYTHTHEDGTVEEHEAGETGVYITYVDFDVAGLWGVEVTGSLKDGTSIVGDGEEPTRPFFPIREKPVGLAVGDPAPASVQTLAADVDDIRSIDTSLNPIAEQHSMTIADAITSGRPTVIAFATPAFCVTQLCGPTKEIFDGLYEEYKSEANFIHIEPYDVEQIRSGACASYGDCVVQTMRDFRLESEPWVFIINADGKVAAKYDGVVSEQEMEDGLTALLG